MLRQVADWFELRGHPPVGTADDGTDAAAAPPVVLVHGVFGSGNIMRGLIDALQPGQTIVHGQCPTVGAGGRVALCVRTLDCVGGANDGWWGPRMPPPAARPAPRQR